MSISIIGAGNVGVALGQALTRRGETVVFGVPEPQKYAAAVAALGDKAHLTSTAEAIAASDLLILAVPHTATAGIAQSVPDWQGKVLVDATNPLAPGLTGLTLGTSTSGAEVLAQQARGARVVKAFNSTGADNMADAAYAGGLPMMPICGDDADARHRVMALATLIGFEAVDMGPLMAARYLEPFAMTWIHMALRQGMGRRFAFGLLRRS
ncbi:MAG: NADPH-dependent F420 reductase [Sphaerotilus sp.]|nr:NADPH-dependent F420 reductase [Sphaerotilus sp.]MDZ7858169.1 NADPH-dependent F420 reductase [Sphaerotilus sp.]